jgi:hypothetical protein
MLTPCIRLLKHTPCIRLHRRKHTATQVSWSYRRRIPVLHAPTRRLSMICPQLHVGGAGHVRLYGILHVGYGTFWTSDTTQKGPDTLVRIFGNAFITLLQAVGKTSAQTRKKRACEGAVKRECKGRLACCIRRVYREPRGQPLCLARA